MKQQENDRRNYEVLEREVISEGEQVAFVWTRSGGYVTGTTPDLFTDVRDAGILVKARDIREAREWFARRYGM